MVNEIDHDGDNADYDEKTPVIGGLLLLVHTSVFHSNLFLHVSSLSYLIPSSYLLSSTLRTVALNNFNIYSFI